MDNHPYSGPNFQYFGPKMPKIPSNMLHNTRLPDHYYHVRTTIRINNGSYGLQTTLSLLLRISCLTCNKNGRSLQAFMAPKRIFANSFANFGPNSTKNDSF